MRNGAVSSPAGSADAHVPPSVVQSADQAAHPEQDRASALKQGPDPSLACATPTALQSEPDRPLPAANKRAADVLVAPPAAANASAALAPTTAEAEASGAQQPGAVDALRELTLAERIAQLRHGAAPAGAPANNGANGKACERRESGAKGSLSHNAVAHSPAEAAHAARAAAKSSKTAACAPKGSPNTQKSAAKAVASKAAPCIASAPSAVAAKPALEELAAPSAAPTKPALEELAGPVTGSSTQRTAQSAAKATAQTGCGGGTVPRPPCSKPSQPTTASVARRTPAPTASCAEPQPAVGPQKRKRDANVAAAPRECELCGVEQSASAFDGPQQRLCLMCVEACALDGAATPTGGSEPPATCAPLQRAATGAHAQRCSKAAGATPQQGRAAEELQRTEGAAALARAQVASCVPSLAGAASAVSASGRGGNAQPGPASGVERPRPLACPAQPAPVSQAAAGAATPAQARTAARVNAGGTAGASARIRTPAGSAAQRAEQPTGFLVACSSSRAAAPPVVKADVATAKSRAPAGMSRPLACKKRAAAGKAQPSAGNQQLHTGQPAPKASARAGKAQAPASSLPAPLVVDLTSSELDIEAAQRLGARAPVGRNAGSGDLSADPELAPDVIILPAPARAPAGASRASVAAPAGAATRAARGSSGDLLGSWEHESSAKSNASLFAAWLGSSEPSRFANPGAEPSAQDVRCAKCTARLCASAMSGELCDACERMTTRPWRPMRRRRVTIQLSEHERSRGGEQRNSSLAAETAAQAHCRAAQAAQARAAPPRTDDLERFNSPRRTVADLPAGAPKSTEATAPHAASLPPLPHHQAAPEPASATTQAQSRIATKRDADGAPDVVTVSRISLKRLRPDAAGHARAPAAPEPQRPQAHDAAGRASGSVQRAPVTVEPDLSRPRAAPAGADATRACLHTPTASPLPGQKQWQSVAAPAAVTASERTDRVRPDAASIPPAAAAQFVSMPSSAAAATAANADAEGAVSCDPQREWSSDARDDAHAAAGRGELETNVQATVAHGDDKITTDRQRERDAALVGTAAEQLGAHREGAAAHGETKHVVHQGRHRDASQGGTGAEQSADVASAAAPIASDALVPIAQRDRQRDAALEAREWAARQVVIARQAAQASASP